MAVGYTTFVCYASDMGLNYCPGCHTVEGRVKHYPDGSKTCVECGVEIEQISDGEELMDLG